MSAVATPVPGWKPEPIRRLLQGNLCLLLCVSGVTFAAAEGNPLGLISVPTAILGLMLTDWRQRWALSSRWGNVLGLAAFVAAASEFFSESVEGRLLSFGHLLLYLAWILLLQPKRTTQVWWLCVLSVLQIATASVLTNDYWFPIVAMAYMLLAMWTLSVFSLDRAVSRSATVERSAPTPQENDSSPRFSAQTATSPSEPDGLTASQSRNTMRLESTSRWITPQFVMGILGCGVLSILLGLTIFLLTPRIWLGRLRVFDESLAGRVQPLTGFTEEVKLGDIGEILENPNIVLEVLFFDNKTDQPMDVDTIMTSLGYDAPVFRGKVLEQYRDGRWSTSPTTSLVRSPRSYSQPGLIRQEIQLHPIGTRTLFAADRAISCSADRDFRIDVDDFRDTFTVDPPRQGRRDQQTVFSYSAYSRSPWSNPRRARSYNYQKGVQNYESDALEIPPGLERLKKLAQSMSSTDDGGPLTRQEVASRILAQLRDSGEYLYTLNVAIEDPTADPVEDFLFHRKEGHCEYFASALALMLRAAGIPSRLVSGFKGGELNPDTGLYEVRQLHAHAWVEAFIDDEWIVFDPTPSSRDASVASMSTQINPWERLRDLLEQLWMRGLFMNQAQQQVEIYRPLASLFHGGLASARGMSIFQWIANWFRELGTNPQQWISGRGFVTAFVLGLIISAIIGTLKSLWRLLRKLSLRHQRGRRQQQRMIVFYERFLRLVAKRGHIRRDASTHREFAGVIEREWRKHGDVDGLATLPTRLADAFYRVRFGEELLADQELQNINASLDRLEQWIAGDRRASPP